MMTSKIYQQTATVYADVLILKHYSPPLKSGLGSTKVLKAINLLAANTAMVKRSIFVKRQYPEPAPSKIGKEDLPGGFKHEAVISGQSNPLYDLSCGIVQIDNVKVLFNATA